MPCGRRPAFPAHRDGGLIVTAAPAVNGPVRRLIRIRASPTFRSFPSGRRHRGSSCSGWRPPTPQTGFCFPRTIRPKASRLELVLVGNGKFRPLPLVHLHALQEIAVGPVGRRVEGDLDLDPALGAHDVDALIGGELRRDGEGQVPALAEIGQPAGQRGRS